MMEVVTKSRIWRIGGMFKNEVIGVKAFLWVPLLCVDVGVATPVAAVAGVIILVEAQ